MRTSIYALFMIVVLLGSNSCSVTLNSRSVDPDLAAYRAILFAKEAFIDLNQPIAYGFLTEEMQRKISLDQFIALVAQMHPLTFPLEEAATEYEPIPGQQSVNIWLNGKNGNETFYHRLTMVGTNMTSYKVANFVRVAELPPSQTRKPLRRTINANEP